MKKLMLAVIFAASASSVSAAELAGVTLPETVQVAGEELVLNGMGLREKFWVDVYVGALYLPMQADSAETAINTEGPSRVVMSFVHDAPADKIIKSWEEGFANNNEKAALEPLRERLDTFNGFFAEDIKDGDVVVFDYVPGEGTHVRINEQEKGVIEGLDFARALRAVWLGPKPPSEDFRDGLLGEE